MQPAVINTAKVAEVGTRNRLVYYCYLLRSRKRAKVQSRLRHLKPSYVLVHSSEKEGAEDCPRVQLVSVVGEVTDLYACCTAMRQLYFFPNRDRILTVRDDPYYHLRTDLTGWKTQSVDSAGTRILDDCFSFRTLPNDYLYLMVHIADITSLIRYTSDELYRLAHQTNTIYHPDRLVNLVGNPEQFSLNVGEVKPAITVSFKINLLNGKEEEFDTFLSLIRNRCSYTFDNYRVPEVLEKYLRCKGEETNGFNLVRVLSSKINTYIGEKFAKNGGCTIWRIVYSTGGAVDEKNIPEWISNGERSEYAWGTWGGVGKPDPYVHFTSPIHRFADQLSHLKLKEVLLQEINFPVPVSDKLDSDVYAELVNIINERTLLYKKLDRELNLALLAHQLEGAEEECLTVESYLIEVEEDARARVYIPQLKRVLSLYLYHPKLEEEHTEVDTEKINEQQWQVKLPNKMALTFNYGQRLTVEISPHLSAYYAGGKVYSVFPSVREYLLGR